MVGTVSQGADGLSGSMLRSWSTGSAAILSKSRQDGATADSTARQMLPE